jgi:tetratricopeptide (TPR) repeat protein
MSSEDWYRNKNWNKDIETEFFAKLKRARSQRDQYLVIQALTLTDNHPKISIRLVEQYFESRKDKFDDVRALLAMAEAYLALGQTDSAMNSFRAVLAREAEFSNHQSGAYVDYPYIVATGEIEKEYDNAIIVLSENVDRLTFPLDYFKWHAAKALIQKDGVQASKALEAAQVKKSGFSFHQSVGLVGKEHEKTIKQLCKIST